MLGLSMLSHKDNLFDLHRKYADVLHARRKTGSRAQNRIGGQP